MAVKLGGYTEAVAISLEEPTDFVKNLKNKVNKHYESTNFIYKSKIEIVKCLQQESLNLRT